MTACLALAACTREIPVQPFRIRATDAAGTSIAELQSQVAIVFLEGTGHLASPSELRVDDARLGRGPIALAFEAAAAPGLAFPAALDAAPLLVEILVDPSSLGPGGVPLPIRGVRVGIAGPAGSSIPRFLIGEGTLRRVDGTPALPRPLGFETPDDVIPSMEVLNQGLYFEPSQCGELYRDALLASGPDRTLRLDAGEEGLVPVNDVPGLPAWTVHHVQSWHRAGWESRGGCAPEDGAWTQLAAWR
jgi:hypothetical protein